MQYVFSAANTARFLAGQLAQVTTNSGNIMPILRDPATGQFVEIAKMASSATPLIAANPLSGLGFLAEMYQNHRGFQAVLGQLDVIKSSLGILQASTAVIGVGTFASVALGAVNLHQTMKLKADVKLLHLDVKDGFLDLQNSLRDQGLEIIAHINTIAQDVEFKQHKLEFIKAYSRFLEATKLMKTAMAIQDISLRKIELSNARQTLGEALAIYHNEHLLSETSAPGKLRRYECAWAIEQAIVMTYQLQGEANATLDRLKQLETNIRQDSIKVINSIQSEAELDFIFPELSCIYGRDLVALTNWSHQINWLKSLSPSELNSLSNIDFPVPELPANNDAVEVPPEQVNYEKIKRKSHYLSLQDQLLFKMAPAFRKERENLVSQKAMTHGHKALNPANCQLASDLTVANLYYYFLDENAA